MVQRSPSIRVVGEGTVERAIEEADAASLLEILRNMRAKAVQEREIELDDDDVLRIETSWAQPTGRGYQVIVTHERPGRSDRFSVLLVDPTLLGQPLLA